jgi:energy-coupling factor transporter ATP-binding protein EcfA2
LHISRIQIEGGFLNNLDLSIVPGLNVLIGARGTGKTSVIELIRYALNTKSYTIDSGKTSLEHAKAVLAGGEVTISLVNDVGEEITCHRRGDSMGNGPEIEDIPLTKPFINPIILSQTEIENIGLSAAGRLSLIDGFINTQKSMRNEKSNIVNAIRAIYKEINALEQELSHLNDDECSLGKHRKELAGIEGQIKILQAGSKEFDEKSNELDYLSGELTKVNVREEVLKRFYHTTEEWGVTLRTQLSKDFGLENWKNEQSEDPLIKYRTTYTQAIGAVAEASKSFLTMTSSIDNDLLAIRLFRGGVEKQLRDIRSELNKKLEGIGSLSRQADLLKSQIAQIESKSNFSLDRKTRLNELKNKRNLLVNELHDFKKKRFDTRNNIAEKINEALSPYIRVLVEHESQISDYESAIAEALRGSGMKYKDVARVISENISPWELLQFVETSDFETLARIISIPEERAARLIGNIRDAGLENIITCEIEDNLKFSLLDGTEYKDLSTLSAGQRCTVILSIVLQHNERILIIDQPEDHLDNAFIANTIIKAIKDNKVKGQIILSTHNANIPVLGDADMVIELTSDGRNGFIEVCEPLSSRKAIDSITKVMEGGMAAFECRALKYKSL